MTRADHREKCIEAQAKSLWRLDCIEREDEFLREGGAIPEKWADPWDVSGCGLRQRQKYIRDAAFIFDSLHGIANTVPPEATEEMIYIGDLVKADGGDIEKVFCSMAKVGNLTNETEKKS